jgi:tRNA(Ile)-lysidine synthase
MKDRQYPIPMKRIEQKVLKYIDEKNLIAKKDKVLVALSGGPDSVFLLHFLFKYKRKLNIGLGALHINHGLRGKDAELDQEFCDIFCRKLGVKFYSIKKNIKDYAVKNKISVEEAGRIIRYKEFEKTASSYNFSKIATAHICNDNAETVLLNLIKGTGLRGISGIPPVRGKIIRPLLCLTKEEILRYLNNYKIDFRTDLTNLEIDFERNFIRNKIIPLIRERLNPNFETAVLKSSEVFKEASDYIEKQLQSFIPGFIDEKEFLRFDLFTLNQIDKDLLSILFKASLEKKFKKQTTFNDCKRIISLVKVRTGKTINLSNNLIAIKERDSIDVYQKKTNKNFEPVEIKPGSKAKFDGKSLLIRKRKSIPEVFTDDKSVEYIKGDNLRDKFVLRRWNAGDRFYPLGMKGSKKISDFLNEQKVPSANKKEQLVLTNNGKIVWVLGLRIDDRFKITKNARKVYELCLK